MWVAELEVIATSIRTILGAVAEDGQSDSSTSDFNLDLTQLLRLRFGI